LFVTISPVFDQSWLNESGCARLSARDVIRDSSSNKRKRVIDVALAALLMFTPVVGMRLRDDGRFGNDWARSYHSFGQD
jgi:hypothetical protein